MIIGTFGSIVNPKRLATCSVQHGVGISIARTPHKVFSLCLRDPSLKKRGQGRFREIPRAPPFLKGERTPLLARPFDPAQGEYQMGEV